VLALALLAPIARSEDAQGLLPVPDYSGDLLRRDRLTDGWNGIRRKWADSGVQLEADWAQTLQSVVDGGRSTGTEYSGSLDYLLFIDLQRMGIVPGAMVRARAESRYGRSVNGSSGTILPVNLDGFLPVTRQPEDDIAIALTDLTYYQFLSERLAFFAGKIETLDSDLNEFASGRGNTQFLNLNLVFNGTLELLPYCTLATGVLWMPTKQVTVSSSLFNTADASTSSGFDDFGDGWTSATEADFQYRLGDLPGGTNVGFVYSGDNRFFNYNGRFTLAPGEGIVPPTSNDTWTIYASGWQYVRAEEEAQGPLDLTNEKPDLQGFGAFWRLGVADTDTNPYQWSISGGLGGRGIIPGRDDDTLGLGYYYTRVVEENLSGVLGIRDHTQGFEFFYNVAVTPAAQLTFDAQIVESAASTFDTAVILGVRVYLRF
jgi:porin